MSFGVNELSKRSVYPTAAGQAIGVRGSALTQPPATATAATSAKVVSNPGPVEYAAQVGASGSPLMWWVILALMLFALMFIARKLGEGQEFASIKMSVYNVIVISLAAIIGINFFKVVFTRFPVPGVTSIMLNA